VTLFITVVHVITCIFLIIVVLLQRGKGAEVGAVFGGGGGATMFGSRGAGNFLTRLTTGAAIIFMLTSLTLAYFGQEAAQSTLFKDDTPAAAESAAPAKPEDKPFAQPQGGGFEEVQPKPEKAPKTP